MPRIHFERRYTFFQSWDFGFLAAGGSHFEYYREPEGDPCATAQVFQIVIKVAQNVQNRQIRFNGASWVVHARRMHIIINIIVTVFPEQ